MEDRRRGLAADVEQPAQPVAAAHPFVRANSASELSTPLLDFGEVVGHVWGRMK